MKYDIKLRIGYEYANPAVGGRHIVCVLPLDGGDGQALSGAKLTITPTPDERVDWVDFFGNHLTEFSFRGAHDGVALDMQAGVTRMHVAQALTDSTLLGALAMELAALGDMGPQSPLHFLSPSVRAPRVAEIIGFARSVVAAEMSVADAMVAVGRRLFQEMRFDPKATTVDTPAAEAFEKRRGVCQDFSHIMIVGLRGIGVPVGYVSGFLRTLPPPGKPRLEGADAMHAWVRVWCGAQLGWVEFDPTNNCLVGNDHIVVAYGRDYSDVAPIKGTMRISGGQKSNQAVDVIPL